MGASNLQREDGKVSNIMFHQSVIVAEESALREFIPFQLELGGNSGAEGLELHDGIRTALGGIEVLVLVRGKMKTRQSKGQSEGCVAGMKKL
jgi:hypothetical protein